MVGQPYRVTISIDMPESEQNVQLGMFMVCAEMRDKATKLRSHSCRTAMLHYRSKLTRAISTLVMSPLIVFGFKEETQHIPIELFSNYEDDLENPVTDVFVEIQTKHIQFYSVTLQITAHFSGLRYIMFHWPVLSASLGTPFSYYTQSILELNFYFLTVYRNRCQLIFHIDRKSFELVSLVRVRVDGRRTEGNSCSCQRSETETKQSIAKCSRNN